jgi:hypothetical protein
VYASVQPTTTAPPIAGVAEQGAETEAFWNPVKKVAVYAYPIAPDPRTETVTGAPASTAVAPGAAWVIWVERAFTASLTVRAGSVVPWKVALTVAVRTAGESSVSPTIAVAGPVVFPSVQLPFGSRHPTARAAGVGCPSASVAVTDTRVGAPTLSTSGPPGVRLRFWNAATSSGRSPPGPIVPLK